MSFFAISNIKRSKIDVRNIGYDNCFSYRFESIEITIQQKENFNALEFHQGNYILHILGNPVLKTKFNEYIESLDFSDLLNDQFNLITLFDQWNGIASCILLNKMDHSILLLNDPLGFFPIFLIENEDGFLFTNELKQIWNYCIETEWDEESIKAFYNNGHFISGRAWFKNCTRLRPATSYYINALHGTISTKRYWSWQEVQKSKDPKDTLIEKFYNTFSNLFKQVDLGFSTIGIGLSGGLDSRWIASEIAKVHSNAEAYTFSESNSIDLIIAKKVAKELKLIHNSFSITKLNWFKERLNQFWECDGLIPIYHFHEGNIYETWKKRYSLIATGFYGGGIYSSCDQLNQRISLSISESFINFGNIDSMVDDSHYNISSIDPYLSWQKISQCGAIQVYTMTKFLKVLIPFYNLEWLKLNYSIDEKYQENSKFYLETLNKYLPKKIMNLIWQRTLWFSDSLFITTIIQKLRLSRVIKKLLRICGYESNFVDYRMLESEIKRINEQLSKPDFLAELHPRTNEQRLRFVSIILWINMWNKQSADVL